MSQRGRNVVIVALLVVAGGGVWYWYSRPKPDTHRYAPAGVYFLTHRVSLTSSTGVRGFPPGTCVRLVSERGDTLRVREGDTEMDIARNRLTNDLDIAEAAARTDTASLRRFEAWRRHQQVALGTQHRKEALDIEYLEKLQRSRALPLIGSTPSPLDRGPYNRR